MNENLIRERLLKEGADLVGFSRLPKSPIKDQENLIYAVTIAVKLPDAVLKTINEKPTIEYFHSYRTANALLDRIAFLGARFIESFNYNAFPIPASQSTADDKSSYRGAFSHKTGARLSGLGFIGKNALFISKEYGSKVRLATILTDMPLSSDMPIIDNGCGDCNLCASACPAGAISGISYRESMEREEFFSAEKCSNHMKNYKDIGRGSVCGICIKVCPYNRLK
ncbi:MAG: epoxyqueuosine reductase [Clostridia bacterium]|nr:epoxyqueuosine reductase [Clostridia bacterium]